MNRWRIAAAAAGLLAALVAVPVQGAEWCLRDPELNVLISPHNSITVYVTEGVMGSQHQAALTLAKTRYTTRTVNETSVLVTIYDYIPTDSQGTFATEMIVSSQPVGSGVVYGTAYGTSGSTMSLSFWINAEKIKR
jgi:hypothetical protein